MAEPGMGVGCRSRLLPHASSCSRWEYEKAPKIAISLKTKRAKRGGCRVSVRKGDLFSPFSSTQPNQSHSFAASTGAAGKMGISQCTVKG